MEYKPNLIHEHSEIAIIFDKPTDKEETTQALIQAGLNPKDISWLSCVPFEMKEKPKKADWNKNKSEFFADLDKISNIKMCIILGVDAYKFVKNSSSGTMSTVFMKPFTLEEYPETFFIANYNPRSFVHDESNKSKFYQGMKQAVEILRAKKSLETTEVKSVVLQTSEDLRNVLPLIAKQPEFAVDTEFSSLQVWKSELFCISFSWENNSAVGIPYKYWDGEKIVPFWDEFCMSEIKYTMREIFGNPDKMITTQNGKSESLICKKEFDVEVNFDFDTMLKAFIDSSKESSSLETLTAKYLPHKSTWKEDFWSRVAKTEIKKEQWYKRTDLYNTVELVEYCNMDAALTWELTNIIAEFK